nr:retrovirus-related Pol polyprotein from transposon TNT 1-94 [Tanacetum cinerariifolium]
MKVKESLNVTFDETPLPSKTSPLEDDDLVEEKAIQEMLKKFILKDSKPMKTPISTKTKLTKDVEGTMHLGLWYPKGSDIETIVYADSDHAGDYVDRKRTSGICTFIGCCLTSWFLKKQTALAISTRKAEYVSARKACQQELWMKQSLVDYGIRPDIMFSVWLCARFQEDPKISHLEAVKRIFRYVKGTMYLGLWYPKGSDIETIVYADSDHAGDYVDRKRTSGICTFMGCCLTSWFLKKQIALAISTRKAEYVSARKACQQELWMKQALVDYGIRLDGIPIMCDNKGAIDLSKNPV